MEIRVLTTPQELFAAAAELVAELATEAVAKRGRFTIALSGGSTPKSLYTLLATNARTSLPWDRMFFFWGDERHVPPTDDDSNYRMASEALLAKVSVPKENIFRVPAEKSDAALAAQEYEQTLRQFFQVDEEVVPRFDLILLGMGPDGHTAFSVPGDRRIAGKVAAGDCELGRETENEPVIADLSGAECGRLRGFPGEWDRQGCGAEDGVGRRRSRRTIPRQAGAPSQRQAHLDAGPRGGQRAFEENMM